MKLMLSSLAALLLLAPATTIAAPAPDAPVYSIEVIGGKEDVKDAIVVERLPETINSGMSHIISVVTTSDGKILPSQVAPAALLDKPGQELSILVPELKAGQKMILKVDLSGKHLDEKGFSWGMADGSGMAQLRRQADHSLFPQTVREKPDGQGQGNCQSDDQAVPSPVSGRWKNDHHEQRRRNLSAPSRHFLRLQQR